MKTSVNRVPSCPLYAGPKVKQCILLKSIVQVHLSTMPGREFRIITTGKQYRLRANTFVEAQSWVDAMDRAAKSTGVALTIKGFVSEVENEEKSSDDEQERVQEETGPSIVSTSDWLHWQGY